MVLTLSPPLLQDWLLSAAFRRDTRVLRVCTSGREDSQPPHIASSASGKHSREDILVLSIADVCFRDTYACTCAM